jgi:hypothetical protein
MERTECVVCSSKNLKFVYSLKEFPMIFLPTESLVSEDIKIELKLYGCENCGSVQLKELLDPKILYSTPHNSTYNTPLWKEHHISLSEFIYNHKDSDSIIEVGGYSGILAKNLLEKDSRIEYTILDICDEDPHIPNVRFIRGNCETYEFSENTTVVMSHVFEHLYEPSKFISNLSRQNVKNVFISIPNMSSLIKNRTIPIVQQEHTFYCDYNDIIYLFSKEKYSCKTSFNFKNHSLFFHFVRNENTNLVENFDIKRINENYSVYEYNKNKIKNIRDFDTPFYIVPAGLYGQIIYYFLSDKLKSQTLGFLDNDPSKIGRRLYGTPFSIFKMDKVKEYDSITVLIFNGVYTNEIREQLNSYNKSIKYVYLE